MEQIKRRSMACNHDATPGREVSRMNRTTHAGKSGPMALAPIVHDLRHAIGWAIVAIGMVELLQHLARAV